MLSCRTVGLASFVAIVCFSVAASEGQRVDLALVLAVDVSASMDPDEQRIQRAGYISAFRHPDVFAAIEAGPTGRIAVTYFEWADPDHQIVIVPWTIVDGPESAEGVAAQLAAAPVNRLFGTSIAGALAYSMRLLETAAFKADRQTIDVSGDGPDSVGPAVVPQRDKALARGITIYGLPIMIRIGWSSGLYSIAGLDLYYEDCVVGGPGAFVLIVKRAAQFEETIRRKIMLEILAEAAPLELIAEKRVIRPIDCMIGHKGGRILDPN